MYGTVARTRVTAENRPKLRELFDRQLSGRQATGYVGAYLLFENDSDVAWLIAMFEDRASYEANAADPAQDAEYREYRALMEEDPEWHDGEIEAAP
jgi:quinol monooxygenase YgiN